MSTQTSIGTPKQLADPNYTPPMVHALPLGLQHIMAMFAIQRNPQRLSLQAPPVFGLAQLSPDFPMMIYMIQMSMILLVSPLIQTNRHQTVNTFAVVQGTSLPLCRSWYRWWRAKASMQWPPSWAGLSLAACSIFSSVLLSRKSAFLPCRRW